MTGALESEGVRNGLDVREEANGQKSTTEASKNKANTASCQGASDLQTCQDLLTGGNTTWVPAKSFLFNSC